MCRFNTTIRHHIVISIRHHIKSLSKQSPRINTRDKDNTVQYKDYIKQQKFGGIIISYQPVKLSSPIEGNGRFQYSSKVEYKNRGCQYR